jgi:hypothetical protein
LDISLIFFIQLFLESPKQKKGGSPFFKMKQTKKERLEEKRSQEKRNREEREKKTSAPKELPKGDLREIKQEIASLKAEAKRACDDIEKYIKLMTSGGDNVQIKQYQGNFNIHMCYFVGHNSYDLNVQLKKRQSAYEALWHKINVLEDILDPSRVERRKQFKEAAQVWAQLSPQQKAQQQKMEEDEALHKWLQENTDRDLDAWKKLNSNPQKTEEEKKQQASLRDLLIECADDPARAAAIFDKEEKAASEEASKMRRMKEFVEKEYKPKEIGPEVAIVIKRCNVGLMCPSKDPKTGRIPLVRCYHETRAFDLKTHESSLNVPCDCIPSKEAGPVYFELSLQNRFLERAGRLVVDETQLRLQEEALLLFGPDFHNNFGGIWTMMQQTGANAPVLVERA